MDQRSSLEQYRQTAVEQREAMLERGAAGGQARAFLRHGLADSGLLRSARNVRAEERLGLSKGCRA